MPKIDRRSIRCCSLILWIKRRVRRSEGLPAASDLSCAPMSHVPRPDAVVIRFRPVDPRRVLERAEQNTRDPDGRGHHSSSVFADHARGAETQDAVIDRLLRDSELDGINPATNPKYWVCTTAKELTDRKFTFENDGWTGEPATHYSVVLGDPPTIEDAKRFLEPFREERR